MQRGIPLHQGQEAEEDVRSWILESGGFDEEGVWDWVKGIGTGAATGAATGSAAGPWGALVGAVLGGALGAAQTASQQSQPAPSAPPRQPAATRPAVAPPPTPRQPVSQPSGGPSAISPEILQQLTQLLPLLTQLLSQQSPTKTTRQPAGEAQDDEISGDYVPDEAFDPDLNGINEALPDEETIQLPEGEAESTPDYPLASRFITAKYYRAMSTPRSILRIVIHITDGGPSINGTISWFKDPKKRQPDGTFVPVKVSAHYIVGQNGEVVQMVRNSDVAWHAGSANGDSIGIEHVARAPSPGKPGIYPTEIQYSNSAALVRWLCEQYAIPMDRAHILGHSEADPDTSHTGCPNSVWNWDYFMNMVTSGTSFAQTPASVAPQHVGTEQEILSEADLSLKWLTEEYIPPTYTTQWMK